MAGHALFQLFLRIHFSLESMAIGLIVTIPCHCLSLTLDNLVLTFFISFWSIKALSEFKEENNIAGWGDILKALLAA